MNVGAEAAYCRQLFGAQSSGYRPGRESRRLTNFHSRRKIQRIFYTLRWVEPTSRLLTYSNS